MRRLALCLVLVAACSDSSGSSPDASTPDAAYDTARCLITGHYGDLGAKTGSTTLGPTALSITLDAGPPRDVFLVRLTDGRGTFATGGLRTGTFTLSGDDLNLNTCGLCLSITADIGMNGPTKFYFATAGSVTLTSTQPPAGTLSNVMLQEITSNGAAVPGGCTGSVDAMAFSAM